MNCPKCGTPLPEGAKFCPECGERLTDVPASKKLEEPLESLHSGAVQMRPASPPPRATPYYPRASYRPYAARHAREVAANEAVSTASVTSASSTTSDSVEDTGVFARVAAEEGRVAEPRTTQSVPVQERVDTSDVPEQEEAVFEDVASDEVGGSFEYDPLTDTTFENGVDEVLSEEDMVSPTDDEAGSDPTTLFSGADVTTRVGTSSSAAASADDEIWDGNEWSDDRWEGDAPKKSTGAKVASVIAIVVVVAAAVAFLAYVTTSWFGPSTWFSDDDEEEEVEEVEEEEEEVEEKEEEEEEVVVVSMPEVQEAVEDYTWEELKQLADLIAAAETDEEGLEIAIEYNLCNDDGTLDGTQTKTFELTDGTEITVRIVGFRADTLSDGTGLAGITFFASTSAGDVAMNADNSSDGGWEESDLREWMNNDLVALLPDDLASVVVTVDKTTNPVADSGETEQVVTSDTLWAISYSEVVGAPVSSSSRYSTYTLEGEQYQLFSDMGITSDTTSDLLAVETEMEFWWMRSPDCNDSIRFLCVTSEGTTGWSYKPINTLSVVMGFCL